MLLEIEDFSVCVIDFFVVMRPNAGVLKPQHGVHPCAEQVGVVFSDDAAQVGDGSMHGIFKLARRAEGLVGFDFHNMELKLFAESESGEFNEVYRFAAVAFDDLVAYGQRL